MADISDADPCWFAFFHRYYDNVAPRRKKLMVDASRFYVEPTELKPGVATKEHKLDLRVKIGKKTWRLHASVVTKYSNFIRMALNPKFESGDRTIELKEEEKEEGIKIDVFQFIITWMYKDWEAALRQSEHFCVPGEFALDVEFLAEIMLAAEFLDMPLLCFELRRDLLIRFAPIILSLSSCPRRLDRRDFEKPFIRAARLLAGGANMSQDLARGIMDFRDRLGLALGNQLKAIKSWNQVFPDDYSVLGCQLISTHLDMFATGI